MTNKNDAKFAFYYLLSLVALIFMALSVGIIIFSIIDKTIADALINYHGDINNQLKFAISALLIATPIFYFVSQLINKGLYQGSLAKDSGLRRWLTYFILLVSSLIVLGVFVGVINVFLSGELTSRFIFKTLTVFLLSVTVFSFYFYDIKREKVDQSDKVIKIFFWTSLSLIIVVFIASWFFVESPQIARARRLDQILTNNISDLETAVNSYYDYYNKLPDNLVVLKNDPRIYLNSRALINPATKKLIVYKKINDQNFELCTSFQLASNTENDKLVIPYSGNGNYHSAGYQCIKGRLYFNIKPPRQL